MSPTRRIRRRARVRIGKEPTSPADATSAAPARETALRRFAAFNLFVAFAFTVMADPVSSIAYAAEAALARLDGDLSSLVLTMALVIGTIAVVAGTYHQLIGRFPKGAAGAEGLAAAFGDAWAFLPVGPLLVDFTLTVAVSCSAAAATSGSFPSTRSRCSSASSGR